MPKIYFLNVLKLHLCVLTLKGGEKKKETLPRIGIRQLVSKAHLLDISANSCNFLVTMDVFKKESAVFGELPIGLSQQFLISFYW